MMVMMQFIYITLHEPQRHVLNVGYLLFQQYRGWRLASTPKKEEEAASVGATNEISSGGGHGKPSVVILFFSFLY